MMCGRTQLLVQTSAAGAQQLKGGLPADSRLQAVSGLLRRDTRLGQEGWCAPNPSQKSGVNRRRISQRQSRRGGNVTLQSHSSCPSQLARSLDSVDMVPMFDPKDGRLMSGRGPAVPN